MQSPHPAEDRCGCAHCHWTEHTGQRGAGGVHPPSPLPRAHGGAGRPSGGRLASHHHGRHPEVWRRSAAEAAAGLFPAMEDEEVMLSVAMMTDAGEANLELVRFLDADRVPTCEIASECQRFLEKDYGAL